MIHIHDVARQTGQTVSLVATSTKRVCVNTGCATYHARGRCDRSERIQVKTILASQTGIIILAGRAIVDNISTE